MKFFALFFLLAAGSAEAATLRPNLQEVLPNVSINGESTALVGRVTVDYRQHQIRLELFRDPCGELTARPDEIRCLALAMRVQTLEVPLERSYLSCGSEVYSGQKDRTPMDGLRTEITVTDHSTRICKDIVPSLLIVEATSFNPWNQETTEYVLMK
jgi:hypothetical protein